MRRYPGFCRRAFEVLRCRTIKPGLAEDGSDALRVLSVDYSVACGTTAHDLHYWIAIGCLIIAAALPAFFIYKLRPRQSAETAEAPDNVIRYHDIVSTELAVSVEEAEEAPCAGSQKTFAFGSCVRGESQTTLSQFTLPHQACHNNGGLCKQAIRTLILRMRSRCEKMPEAPRVINNRMPIVCQPSVAHVYTPHSLSFLTGGLSGACPSLGSKHL